MEASGLPRITQAHVKKASYVMIAASKGISFLKLLCLDSGCKGSENLSPPLVIAPSYSGMFSNRGNAGIVLWKGDT